MTIEAKIQYGDTSSSEFNRTVLNPTAVDFTALMDELGAHSTGFMTLREVAGADRPIVAEVTKGDAKFSSTWHLTLHEGGLPQLHLDIESQQRVSGLVIDWAFSRKEKFDIETATDPSDGISQPPTAAPQFMDSAALQAQVKAALIKSWEKLGSTYDQAEISGFGLDTVGDPFLLPTAFVTDQASTRPDERWVPAESPAHLVGEEFFEDVNHLIEQSMEAFTDWENRDEEDDGVDEMEVNHEWRSSIFDAGIAALTELRSEGLFAGSPELVLNLWHMDDVPTPEDVAHRCNPGDVADRYLAEISQF